MGETGWAVGAGGKRTDGPEGAEESPGGTDTGGAEGTEEAEEAAGAAGPEEGKGTAETEEGKGTEEGEGPEGGGGRCWDEDCMPDGGGAGAQGGWPVGGVVPNLNPHVSQN